MNIHIQNQPYKEGERKLCPGPCICTVERQRAEIPGILSCPYWHMFIC